MTILDERALTVTHWTSTPVRAIAGCARPISGWSPDLHVTPRAAPGLSSRLSVSDLLSDLPSDGCDDCSCGSSFSSPDRRCRRPLAASLLSAAPPVPTDALPLGWTGWGREERETAPHRNRLPISDKNLSKMYEYLRSSHL